MRALLTSYYVGTGGLDIGLFHSIMGITGGESWERSYIRHSHKVCKRILNVVKGIMDEALVEEINLKIAAKLKGRRARVRLKISLRVVPKKLKLVLTMWTTYESLSPSIWDGRRKERVILTTQTPAMHTSLALEVRR